jgi:hypothetical protein
MREFIFAGQIGGFAAMLEVIRDALIWLASFILDRPPQIGEAIRLILLAVSAGLAVFLGFFWREIACRIFPGFRRRILPELRYSGRFLQAIRHGDEVRYAIVSIAYDRRRKLFDIAGRNYTSSGEALSSIKSSQMILSPDREQTIEFIWQARRRTSGYTRMTVEASNEGFLEGDGLVVTLGLKPKAFPLLFKELHDRYVWHALEIGPPANAGEEPAFIRAFHAKLGPAVMEGFAADGAEIA